MGKLMKEFWKISGEKNPTQQCVKKTTEVPSSDE